MKFLFSKNIYLGYILLSATAIVVVEGCTISAGNTESLKAPAPSLPVVSLKEVEATTYREFSAALEGKVNVEIRPRVEGYLDKIFVDEGAFVKAGQPLFKINDSPFRQELANARASLLAAQANVSKAKLEVERLTPLVKNNVVSDIQLKSAEANLQNAEANVSQTSAMVSNAEINLGYTLIKASVSGYIGRIPMKPGSLVGRGETEPLTVLSDVSEIYAYFAMSEIDFLDFKSISPGLTIEEKLKNFSNVELILADGTTYPEKGRIETIEGQFDKTIGAISFRAVFPNNDRLIRSGNTGRVRLPRVLSKTLAIPQEATFELQDKVLVFVVNDSSKVVSKPIKIKDRSDNYYFVTEGLKPGDKIVYSGFNRLRDGASIQPVEVSVDSLLKVRPL